MMDNILNEVQLCPMTGHQTREGLKSWLNNNKIPFVVARNGWPLVHIKALERAMGVVESVQVSAAPVEFNFEAVK